MTDHPRSPCYGDPRFTTTRSAEVAEALAICKTCTDRACRPILADIRRHDRTMWTELEGVWDGRYYSPATTGRKRVAA